LFYFLFIINNKINYFSNIIIKFYKKYKFKNIYLKFGIYYYILFIILYLLFFLIYFKLLNINTKWIGNKCKWNHQNPKRLCCIHKYNLLLYTNYFNWLILIYGLLSFLYKLYLCINSPFWSSNLKWWKFTIGGESYLKMRIWY